MTTPQLTQWTAALGDILPRVLEFRRELHQHPELSGQEQNTKSMILTALAPLGLEVREFDGCCAVMATLRNGDGPCVAIRADMDALPITEETGLPFASRQPGVMHACGHDVHMALALGSALWLSQHREGWQGTVKWLFEPMEETLGGGQFMVAQGCMENPAVDVVIGQHVNPRYPVGVFFCKPGYVSGASDELHLTVRGKSCHGAYPEAGVDAIVLTAQILSALQTLVSRSISPFEPAVLTFGTIQGGTANNVVCGEVRLTGTLRTLSDSIRRFLQTKLRETAEGIARSMGGEAVLEIRPSYGAVYNDDHYYEAVEHCAKQLMGDEGIVRRAAPSLGVESFYYFVKDTPGVYYDLGSGVSTALHTPTLTIDEAVLPLGIALQCESVMALLRGISRGESGNSAGLCPQA